MKSTKRKVGEALPMRGMSLSAFEAIKTTWIDELKMAIELGLIYVEAGKVIDGEEAFAAVKKHVQNASYRFTEKASEDLESLGKAQTAFYLSEFENAVKKLSDTPKLGKSCNDLSRGLRSFAYESHVIYYLVEEKRMLIVRILHERMSAPLQFVPFTG